MAAARQVQHLLLQPSADRVRGTDGEDALRRPFGEYGVQKAAIERYLLDRARRHGLPSPSCIRATSADLAGHR